MSQEQRDSYVIPPNFIEGGSFFGGLFKARNVVEAVILAAGTGLPILTLSLTLTVRIILLCLTSLPLALLALIGIAGMPLSSYIILFFRFLRNRRTLSKSGGKSSRKQAILPTWDKKSGPSTAVQPAAYKKDGSRIRFAKDTRRLMLDTSYRQKKQAERPGNPLAAYVPIQKIENGIVYTTDHRFIKILEIVPINFLLRSAREQRNIVYSFISYLKIAPVKLQIKVITKRADMNRHIETVRREMAQETNESCRMQQEDYLKLLKKLEDFFSSWSMNRSPARRKTVKKRMPFRHCKQRRGRRQIISGNAATASFSMKMRTKPLPNCSIRSSAAEKARTFRFYSASPTSHPTI